MATPSTLRLVHPDIRLAPRPEARESRLRRLFRGRSRRHRAATGFWREETTFRAMTRLGA